MVNDIVMKYYSDMVAELGKTVSTNGDLSNDEIRQLMEKNGLTLNQLVFRLASSKAELFVRLQQAEAENQRLKETCRRQARALEKYAAESKLSKSAAEVRNGKRLAEKLSTDEYDILLRQGYTNSMIMEKYGVSRSTIWRKQKELQQRAVNRV